MADGLVHRHGANQNLRQPANARIVLWVAHAKRNGPRSFSQEEEKIKNCIEVDHIGKEEFLIKYCQSVLLLFLIQGEVRASGPEVHRASQQADLHALSDFIHILQYNTIDKLKERSQIC